MCLQNSKASVAREMNEKKETSEMTSVAWPDHVGLLKEPVY